jgi:hypothetical protein
LWIRPGAYPRGEQLKGVSLGQAVALLANIKIGWKGLPGTSNLAHYEHLQTMPVKKSQHLARAEILQKPYKILDFTKIFNRDKRSSLFYSEEM